jgi:hypothetical protein
LASVTERKCRSSRSPFLEGLKNSNRFYIGRGLGVGFHQFSLAIFLLPPALATYPAKRKNSE